MTMTAEAAHKPVYIDIMTRATAEGLVRKESEAGKLDAEFLSPKEGQLREVAHFIACWQNIKQSGKDVASAVIDLLNMPAAVVEVVAGGLMGIGDGLGAAKDRWDIFKIENLEGIFDRAKREVIANDGLCDHDKKVVAKNLEHLKENLQQMGARDAAMFVEGLARGVVAAPYYFGADLISAAKNLLVDAPVHLVAGVAVGGGRGIRFAVEAGVAKFLKGVAAVGRGIAWVGQKLTTFGKATDATTTKGHDALMKDAYALYNKSYEANIPDPTPAVAAQQ